MGSYGSMYMRGVQVWLMLAESCLSLYLLKFTAAPGELVIKILGDNMETEDRQ